MIDYLGLTSERDITRCLILFRFIFQIINNKFSIQLFKYRSIKFNRMLLTAEIFIYLVYKWTCKFVL